MERRRGRGGGSSSELFDRDIFLGLMGGLLASLLTSLFMGSFLNISFFFSSSINVTFPESSSFFGGSFRDFFSGTGGAEGLVGDLDETWEGVGEEGFLSR